MTQVTIIAQNYMARLLVQKANSIYVGLGKSSAWSDENTPPAESNTAIALDEPILYKKVTTAELCRLTNVGETGGVIVGTDSYVVATTADMNNPDYRYLYCEVNISGADAGAISYREIGLFSDLTPNSGVTKTTLLPADVSSTGTLLTISNYKVQNITDTGSVTVGIIYSFKPIVS